MGEKVDFAKSKAKITFKNQYQSRP